jgi:hypothetical protein
MQHNAPHSNAAFEGYYNKFDLPSGAHLVIVICKVKNAQTKPDALSFVYTGQDPSKTYHKVIYVEKLEMKRLNTKDDAFILDMPGIGYAKWSSDSTTEYVLEHEMFSFHATTTSRVPWSEHSDSPEGMLVHLPLPLHWHVQSLASKCKFSMQIPGFEVPSEDSSGEAIVHQEKNWAFSFPSAHMWVQCRKGDKGFCCAGGQILGLEAFLLGYRSKDMNFDFRPPFAVRVAGFSPFMSYAVDWENRSFDLTVQSFRRKVMVHAVAPKGSFFPLSPPFPEGHRSNYLNQSFQANIEIKMYESGWFGPWKLVRQDLFEGGSLEFGGNYYPLAGSGERFN